MKQPSLYDYYAHAGASVIACFSAEFMPRVPRAVMIRFAYRSAIRFLPHASLPPALYRAAQKIAGFYRRDQPAARIYDVMMASDKSVSA